MKSLIILEDEMKKVARKSYMYPQMMARYGFDGRVTDMLNRLS